MSKLKIVMPDSAHCCDYRVLYGDTDAGGVVYNANYLRFFEMGRTEFMREQVLSYRDLEEKGFILPVVESYLRFKAPAFYDDLLVVKTFITDVKEISCRFNYHILRKTDDKLLVKGFTIHASIGRDGKLRKLPSDLFLKLSALS